MYPLKEQSIIQKIKSIFSPNKIKYMDNIFGNIQLIPIQSILLEPNSINKQPQYIKPKQNKSTGYRHTIDYQNSKRRTQCMKEIIQLKNNIKQTKQKNQLLYNSIIKLSSQFTYVLFEPRHYLNQNYNKNEDIKFVQQKLLIQLDKLYEQNCLLQKQMNRLRFVQQNELKQKEQNLVKRIDHYKFLRNIWYQKSQLIKYNNSNIYDQKYKQLGSYNRSEDMIQRLNKKVGMVKLSINNIIKQQKQSIQNNNFVNNNNEIQDEYIIKSNKYQRLLQLYQHKSMQLEDILNHNIYNNRNNQQNKQQHLSNQLRNNHDQNQYILNLNNKIQSLQLINQQNQNQILLLKQQLKINSQLLYQFKIQQHQLTHIFYSNHNNKQLNQLNKQFIIKIYQPNINIENEIKQQIQNYQINTSISQFIENLKKQNKIIHTNTNLQTIISLKLKTIPFNSSQRSPSIRKSLLGDIDMNKINTDRLSLIKKTNKLTQSLNGSNTLRRNVSRQRQLRISKTNIQNKQNFAQKPFIQCYQQQSIEFPSQTNSIYLQTDLRAKFVRTSNRAKKQSLR